MRHRQGRPFRPTAALTALAAGLCMTLSTPAEAEDRNVSRGDVRAALDYSCNYFANVIRGSSPLARSAGHHYAEPLAVACQTIEAEGWLHPDYAGTVREQAAARFALATHTALATLHGMSLETARVVRSGDGMQAMGTIGTSDTTVFLALNHEGAFDTAHEVFRAARLPETVLLSVAE